ncbi:MAG TPA: hypothetical protein VMU64_10545 [Acidimicrobiales bacterium]|nr:hypothetical protein [Acidimicrobiales bacterium]
MATYEGWAPDPFDAHEVRYFVNGLPTKLVRDGSVEAFDDLPPRSTWPQSLQTPRPAEPIAVEPVHPIARAPVESPVSHAQVEPIAPVPVAPPVIHFHAAVDPVVPAPFEPVLQPPPPPPPPPLGTSYWTPPPAPGAGIEQPQGPGTSPPVQAFGETRSFALGHTDTFTVGSELPPPRRPWRRLVTGMVAVVVLAAAGSVIAVAAGGKTAEAAVIDSVNSTMAYRTAHITMNLSAREPTGTITGTGTGGIDFTNNAMELRFTTDAATQQITIQAVYLGGSIYENIPGIDQLVPGKSWVSIDLSALGVSASQSTGSLGTADNPAAMLRLLTQEGNTVVPLGSSSIEGTPVQGYSVTLNSAAIEKQLADAKLPSWMTAALSHVDIGDTTVKVFVDGSGLLRRMSIGLTETVSSSGTVSVNESLDFSDYGSPVDVSAPPADQVMSFEQFLKDAEAAAGGTSS